MKTPFGYKMQTELANEFSRLDSEWFFPWHGLNSGREINIDRFDGRRIRLGGGPYGGSDESVYWTAIGRYLDNKINEIFELADKEIRDSDRSNVQAIVEDSAIVAEQYCWRVRRQAIDTDRRLKGRGNPDPDYSSPYADRMEFTGEIARRKAALASFYVPEEAPLPSPLPLPKNQRYERFYERHKGKWATIALIVAIIGATLGVLRFL